MKELRHSSLTILQNSVLTCRKAELVCFFFVFFLSGFFFMNIMIHRVAGEGGGYLFNSSLPLPFHRHLDISQIIAAESSTLRIAGSRTQIRSLWFPIGSRQALS